MARHLAAQAELLAVGRQQELDRGGVEADAVVQPLHAVGRVDALERQHGGQDLALGDGGRIAREQRLDEEVPAGLDDEIHLVARNVVTRQLVDDRPTWAMTIPSLKAVASTTVGVSSMFGPV